ncbi:MAG: glycosyltransferase family 9 protein, partial [Bryobacteraceae bacterium]
TGKSVLIDKGAGMEEHARVERAVLPGMRTHDGAFAPFAAQIARSNLYVGYDSAGQHVASACGVPLISIFKGFVSERMFARWRPEGVIIRGDSDHVLEQVRAAITCTFRR